MIKYAAIKDNKVVNTLVFDDPSIEELEEFATLTNVDFFVPLSDSAVGIGCDYIDGVLIPFSPFPSWIWNSEKLLWEPPVPEPEFNADNPEAQYAWHEDSLSWTEVRLTD
jgi:hypothetical protein